MNRSRRRTPYWALLAFAGLLTLPFGWAVGVLAGVAVAQVVWSALRERGRARGVASTGAQRQLVLGSDPRGRPVMLGEDQLGAHALIVGASGAGKSTTLLRILSEQIAQGRPVIALDLKGSPAFAADLKRAALANGRRFGLWTLDGPAIWNPLAHGNATELKDRLIGSERFTEPHYRRAAERYVQTALQVLEATGRRPALNGVVALLEPRRLSAVARGLDTPLGERVRDYLDSLTPDQLSAVQGLGTRLALLSESSAGPFLSGETGGDMIDIRSALSEGGVVMFSLNSSRYGSLAAQVGTLVIQDLISASGERLASAGRAPATVALDEFSALGSDHVLALLARGREAGFSVLLATQELSDLERAGRGFRDQVLGLTAVKIAHRQDVPSSAQTIAEMSGTRLVWDETRPLRSVFGPAGGRGTRRQVERFRVHPNVIKTLGPGEAVLLVKSPSAGVTPVKVARAQLTAPAGRAPTAAAPTVPPTAAAPTVPPTAGAPTVPPTAGAPTVPPPSAAPTAAPRAATTPEAGRVPPAPRPRPALPRPGRSVTPEGRASPSHAASSPGEGLSPARGPGSGHGPNRGDQPPPGVTR